MDAYPPEYIALSRPLILLSGIDQGSPEDDYPSLLNNGLLIDSDIPPLNGLIVNKLQDAFLEVEAGFNVKSVGRSYTLPRRKADPFRDLSISPVDEVALSSYILHSPLSPLTPGSATFPDGLLSPLWFSKHQSLVPAAVINFFPLSQDPNMSSLRDNQLKIEINSLKQGWTASGFKTRFLVVFLSDGGDPGSLADVDDRIAGIRRAANLDQKSVFVISSDAGPAELKEFASSLLSLLHPSVMEYYRDLSKHARRKRNRGSIPPPTLPPTGGTSQTLSHHGWNVRYEFKLGVFAEFRQEMDAAFRNYQSAYDTLFGQEVFEIITGWSPRFNDARLLSDALAIRIIRCLLRAGSTSAAVRSWMDHRNRTQDIVHRQGKGTRNYGWEAWESRWSKVMAELIRGAQIPSLLSSVTHPLDSDCRPTFVPYDGTVSNGGLHPWEQLHHAGYWLYRAAKHSVLRRALAEQIPEEDRVSPSQSSASQIANKSYLYDTYLVPEPHIEAPREGGHGFDHSKLILDDLKASMEEFSKRNQTRKVESVSLEIAEEYMRAGAWTEAHAILRPLWPTLSWRRSGWWQLMARLAWALRECSLKVQDPESVIQVNWELLSKAFQPRSSWNYDIHRSLKTLPAEVPKPSVVIRAEDTVSSLTASFVFQKADGNVGEPLHAQLVLSSYAQPSSKPIRLSEVKIIFEGCLRPVKLQAADQNTNTDVTNCSPITLLNLYEPGTLGEFSTLQSPPGSLNPLSGTADLTVGPSQNKVFSLTCIPREAGETRVASITMAIDEDMFSLVHVTTGQTRQESFWWQQTGTGLSKRRVGKDRDTSRCRIMPKPPKIRITTPGFRGTYYTDEHIAMRVNVHNDEDEAANVSVEARLFGRSKSAAQLLWLDEKDDSQTHEGLDSLSNDGNPHFIKRSIGILEHSSKKEHVITLSDTQTASDYELEISSTYYLLSDVYTPIIKTVTINLSVITPFEANYEFLPQLHPEPWPNFFCVDDGLLEGKPGPGGLQQRICFNSKMVSFALEPLMIEKVSLILLGLTGGAVCDIRPESTFETDELEVSPKELHESNFILDVQKYVLGDRRPTVLSLALEVRWRRIDADKQDHSAATSTRLAVPRFVVPIGEPRVLASATASRILGGLIHVDYTLENPSVQFLTFNLTMEASEDFAFSGPKVTTVQLLPLSRHVVRYNLLASRRGCWVQPMLTVVDTYFNKTLRILPTKNMRSDKNGVLIWIDVDDE